MPQIMLYDASTGELAPIVHGDAIRVEIHTANLAYQGLVDVASTRPFVLFSLLQRLLQSEGLPTKFLFGSPGAGEVLRELDLATELDDAELEEEGAYGEGDEDSDEEDFDLEEEIERRRLARAAAVEAGEDADDAEGYEGRCVDIRFGAAREGEQEWAGGESAGSMTLSEAMRRFGHHALVFYLMGTHYSQPLGDPVLGLTNARKHLQRLSDTLAKLHCDRPSPQDMGHHVEAFREALATDLDTPSAFVALFEWVLEAERRGCDLGDRDLRGMLELLELADLAPGARGARSDRG
jgi:hypothetical protein